MTVKNNVLVVSFNFDEPLTDISIYKQTRDWLTSLDVSDWVYNLVYFSEKDIKKSVIEMSGTKGFLFKVYTNTDLTIVDKKFLHDIEDSVEGYVYKTIEPEYQSYSFGIRKEKRYFQSGHHTISNEGGVKNV